MSKTDWIVDLSELSVQKYVTHQVLRCLFFFVFFCFFFYKNREENYKS